MRFDLNVDFVRKIIKGQATHHIYCAVSTDTIIMDYGGITFESVEIMSLKGSYWEDLTHVKHLSPGTPDLGNVIVMTLDQPC